MEYSQRSIHGNGGGASKVVKYLHEVSKRFGLPASGQGITTLTRLLIADNQAVVSYHRIKWCPQALDGTDRSAAKKKQTRDLDAPPVNCFLGNVSIWSQEVRVGSTHILYHDGVLLLCKQIFRSTWRSQIQSNPKGLRAVSSVRFHVCDVGA
jgi:hypothetical protein